MKVTVQVSKTVYETKEVELPFYSEYDTGGDGYTSQHWVRHEEKQHVTITHRDYYDGHVIHEIETGRGHGLEMSGSYKSSRAEFFAALGRMQAFIDETRAKVESDPS